MTKLEKNRIYYQEHRQEILKKRKAYYQEHKVELNAKAVVRITERRRALKATSNRVSQSSAKHSGQRKSAEKKKEYAIRYRKDNAIRAKVARTLGCSMTLIDKNGNLIKGAQSEY